MEHFVVHSALWTFTAAVFWGGLAAGAAVFALLLVAETNSGVRPAGCDGGSKASKAPR